MRAISDFFPRLLPHVVGCPDPLAQQAVLDAAIEFCERSQVLREQLDPVSLVIGQAEYDLYAPPQQEIARVMSVALDSATLLQADLDEVRFDTSTTNAKPLRFYTVRLDSIFSLRVSPAPDDVGTLVATVALRPARDATHLHGELFTRWIDPIVQGALFRLRTIPGQPFSDLALAGAAAAAAARLTNRARVEGNYGRVRGSMHVQFRPLA